DALFFQPPVIRECLLAFAVIFYNQNIIVFVGGFLLYGTDTVFQSLFLILIGNEDAYQRFSLNRIVHMIKAEILGLNHRARCSRSSKISLYGPLPGLVGVQFAGGVVGSGCPV